MFIHLRYTLPPYIQLDLGLQLREETRRTIRLTPIQYTTRLTTLTYTSSNLYTIYHTACMQLPSAKFLHSPAYTSRCRDSCVQTEEDGWETQA